MPDSAAVVARLIGEYPLAWVIAGDFSASLLPLLAERDATGAITSLIGHCSKRNPLIAAFARDRRGLILFNGPSGYISPQLIDRPDWAPTWNYAAVRLEVDVELTPDATAASLERLLDHMEGVEERWSVAGMGPRYDQLLQRIVAFRADIRVLDPRLKLGRDEGAAEFAQIVARHPNRALADWMAALDDRGDLSPG